MPAPGTRQKAVPIPPLNGPHHGPAWSSWPGVGHTYTRREVSGGCDNGGAGVGCGGSEGGELYHTGTQGHIHTHHSKQPGAAESFPKVLSPTGVRTPTGVMRVAGITAGEEVDDEENPSRVIPRRRRWTLRGAGGSDGLRPGYGDTSLPAVAHRAASPAGELMAKPRRSGRRGGSQSSPSDQR